MLKKDDCAFLKPVMVIALTTLVMLVGIAIPFTPFAPVLKLTPLPIAYFPWLISILIAYSLLMQYVKVLFIKKFNQCM